MDNKTKQRILNAATNVFVQKGFSGTSISDIAKMAEVNQSLIYHHVGNKQELWQEVKRFLIGDIPDEENKNKNLESFVHDLVHQRVTIYDKDPRIVRVIQWQNLEDDDSKLINTSHVAPTAWIKDIEFLQEKGEIRTDYTSTILTVYVHSLINGVLLDYFKVFHKDLQLRTHYINLIISEMIRTLKNNTSLKQ